MSNAQEQGPIGVGARSSCCPAFCMTSAMRVRRQNRGLAVKAHLAVGMPLAEAAGLPLSPTTAPPSPSGSRSKSSSVYMPQLRPIIWMAFGIFVPMDHLFQVLNNVPLQCSKVICCLCHGSTYYVQQLQLPQYWLQLHKALTEHISI